MAYTKADFDAMYQIRAEREWGRSGADLARPEIRVGYQREPMRQILEARWATLVPYLGLTVADVLVLAGSGFGWGLNVIQDLLPGINAVGVDISAYVQAEKDTDDVSEIEEYVTNAGLDPASGRGLQIVQRWSTPGRNKADVVVLEEDMKTNQSRNRVRQALGNNTPTHVFTEDMIQDFTDLEIAEWVTELDKLTTTAKIHVISGEGIRTSEEIQTLTGHRVLLVSGGIVHKDLP